jgi:beta-lactamase class A
LLLKPSAFRIVLLFLLPLTTGTAMAQSPLAATAQNIADQITDQPHLDEAKFAPVFLAAAPLSQLSDLLRSIHTDNGPVLHVIARDLISDTAGQFDFVFAKATLRVTVSLEAAEPHRLDGIYFKPGPAPLQSLDDARTQLAALPGQVSFEFLRLDDGKVLASLHPDKALGIGSAFKLYVLAELLRQHIAWDRVITIDEQLKSLPTGELQTWPAGSPITVNTLAIKMISKSDNTAADHLLALVGHTRVQAALAELGMADPAADAPFLSTRQLFLLKWDDNLRAKYLAGDAAAREAMLGKMTQAPELADLPSAPVAIDTIEWFASAADLCRLMQWFDQRNDTTAAGILAVNPGLDVRSDLYDYIGFKGGSEPGVLNLTWLLHSRTGHRYALSATWNNRAASGDLDLAQFGGLMLGITDLAGKNAIEPP